MGLQEGFNVGSTSLYRLNTEDRIRESSLLNDAVERKWREEQILASQAESKQAALEWERKQARDKAFLEMVQGPPPAPGTAAPGLPTPEVSMPVGAAQGGGGPAGAAKEATYDEFQTARATPPPPAQGTAGGTQPATRVEAEGFLGWLKMRPGLLDAYAVHHSNEDSAGMNKIYGMWSESVGGSKDQRPTMKKLYDEAIHDRSWDPATQGGLAAFMEHMRKSGAMTMMGHKPQSAWDVGKANSAVAVRKEYRQGQKDAHGISRDYRLMYRNVLNTEGTGALASLKIGLRKMALVVGSDYVNEVADAMTGIAEDDVGRWENLRVQTMKKVFAWIRETKGAISEREMAAFEKASPGYENTQMGNLMIIEEALYIQEGIQRQAQYILDNTGAGTGPDSVKAAEDAWLLKLEMEGPEKEKALNERLARMSRSAGVVGWLMENENVPGAKKAFYEEQGWLPRGMKVDAKWKFAPRGVE